jgi:hypothetical protein
MWLVALGKYAQLRTPIAGGRATKTPYILGPCLDRHGALLTAA